jgi:biopolymer transport protein ExbD
MLSLVLSSLSGACARPEPVASSCPPCASVTPCPSALAIASAVPLDGLPPATGGEPQATMQVDVLVNGRLFANGAQVDGGPRGLLAIAQKVQAANPEVRATIRADKDVSHGQVIEVLDTLKQAGISRIAFAVSPASPAASATP